MSKLPDRVQTSVVIRVKDQKIRNFTNQNSTKFVTFEN